MIPRYANTDIDTIFSDAEKLRRWDKVELAVILSRVNLGLRTSASFGAISAALNTNPPDVAWWLARDKEIQHDLNAYIDERRRHLSAELQSFFHEDMTSYDTEEAAFAEAPRQCCALVEKDIEKLLGALRTLAERWQYTPFVDRTHGQWAKLKSFGARILGWIAALQVARDKFLDEQRGLRYSRLSGAIGNYGGGLSPEIEEAALQILGFKPFYGATQIMPRGIYVPLAQSLSNLASEIANVALTVRLSARSGRPLCHEPFGKKQKGSSAMPHKKNTIKTEQMTGMANMAESRSIAIKRAAETWEARDIAQSCVERVEWPDIFHVVLQMLGVMTKVFEGLVVYPDNMLAEMVEARGTYASDEAKNFLATVLGTRGVGAEEAYLVMQLACFNVFEPSGFYKQVRERKLENLNEADALLEEALGMPVPTPISIQHLIKSGQLRPNAELEATEESVAKWNSLLREIFSSRKARRAWDELFRPSRLLRHEHVLYTKIL